MIAADTPVVVTRQPGDWRKITVNFGALEGLHVASTTGGVRAGTPRPVVAAFTSCDEIPAGAEFGHSCRHGQAPHRIKVIVEEVDNAGRYPEIHALAESAPPPRAQSRAQHERT